MKRKVKLFTSIASLCLAVALMAFGVYAATSVTYNVTSSVTFASQAKVQFVGTLTGGVTGTETRSDNYSTTGDEAEDAATHTWTVGEVKFGPSAAEQEIVYTITCKNLGKTAVDVLATGTVFGNANLDVEIEEGKEGSTATGDSLSESATTLQENEIYKLVITVSIVDVSVAVTDLNTLTLAIAVE